MIRIFIIAAAAVFASCGDDPVVQAPVEEEFVLDHYCDDYNGEEEP